jgi:hypothetical protein
MTFSIA